MPAALADLLIAERSSVLGNVTGLDLVKLVPIIFPLGGQFLADPNEHNGWGAIGPYDNSNTQDLGNVGTNTNRVAGGLCFPFDVKLNRFYAWHRNNNVAVEPWGWRIGRQLKTADSNTVSRTSILDEVGDNAGVGPRDYASTENKLVDINLSANPAIPAGEVVVLGIESPTAVTTNRYVQIMSGFFEFERV